MRHEVANYYRTDFPKVLSIVLRIMSADWTAVTILSVRGLPCTVADQNMREDWSALAELNRDQVCTTSS